MGGREQVSQARDLGREHRVELLDGLVFDAFVFEYACRVNDAADRSERLPQLVHELRNGRRIANVDRAILDPRTALGEPRKVVADFAIGHATTIGGAEHGGFGLLALGIFIRRDRLLDLPFLRQSGQIVGLGIG